MRTSDHFLNYRHMKLIYLLALRIIFPFIAYVKHFRKINTFMFIATFLHPVFQKTALSKVFFVFSPLKRLNFRLNVGHASSLSTFLK